jgi:AraC-like DNA-binding protein
MLPGPLAGVLDKNDLGIMADLGVPVQSSRIRVFRHESPGMSFDLAFAPPHDALRAYVREYVGWADRSSAPGRRREVPSGIVPLIINFGSTIRERKADAPEWCTYGTFTAGLHERYTLVESAAAGHGIQVNFTAMGARLFYDRPMLELTNRTVELSDVIGAAAERLTSKLYDARSWGERFAILDREVGARIETARQPPPAVARAWHQLVNSGGHTRIREVASATSWSDRHFTNQFREHVGLAPKAFARILRFNRAVRLLKTGRGGNLACVAQTCGYYDQAHLARDFRVFAGIAPSVLVRSRIPQNAGFRSDP